MSRLLAIDAGNSNIVLGLYDGEILIHLWRIHTDREKLADEYARLIDGLLEDYGYISEGIDRIAFSNVVPDLQFLFENLARDHFKKDAFFVGPENHLNFKISIDNPVELGADLIAAAAAGVKLYGAPNIMIDMGTATTLTAISRDKEFLGGIIAPGLKISMESLYRHAPHLPRVKMGLPPEGIPSNTIHSLQSGIFGGYRHMLSGLIEDLKNKLGNETRVVATGGLAGSIASDFPQIEEVNPHLVLDGIKYLYELNRER